MNIFTPAGVGEMEVSFIQERALYDLAALYRKVLRRNKVELFGSEVVMVSKLRKAYAATLSAGDFLGFDPEEVFDSLIPEAQDGISF